MVGLAKEIIDCVHYDGCVHDATQPYLVTEEAEKGIPFALL